MEKGFWDLTWNFEEYKAIGWWNWEAIVNSCFCGSNWVLQGMKTEETFKLKLREKTLEGLLYFYLLHLSIYGRIKNQESRATPTTSASFYSSFTCLHNNFLIFPSKIWPFHLGLKRNQSRFQFHGLTQRGDLSLMDDMRGGGGSRYRYHHQTGWHSLMRPRQKQIWNHERDPWKRQVRGWETTGGGDTSWRHPSPTHDSSWLRERYHWQAEQMILWWLERQALTKFMPSIVSLSFLSFLSQIQV